MCEINSTSDHNNCGTCGHVCTATETCVASVCTPPPANDTCAAGAVIALGAAQVTVTGNTASATHDALTTCGSGPDVYYRFTLTQRELVYVDSYGSAFDSEVSIYAGCAGASLACNDDSCATAQSQVTAVLDPGTYSIAISGFAGRSGAYTLNFQHIPVPAGSASSGLLPVGASDVTGTTVGAPTQALCAGTSPTRWYQFVTCPGYAGGAFTATTCAPSTASYDTTLAVANGLNATGDACNDDSCGLQSSVAGTASAGAGIHMLYVSGFNGASGTYTAHVVRP